MRAKSGNIFYEKERNTWRASISTPGGGRARRRFRTKQEAQDWIAGEQSAMAQGIYVEPQTITLGTWLVMWLKDYKKASLSQRTFERYAQLARLCGKLSGCRLQSVTAPMIQELYADLSRERGLGSSTIKKLHNLLHAAFKKALQIDILPRNIIDAVDPPKLQPMKEIQTFSRDELNEILDVAKTFSYGHYYAMLLLAVTTGMRMGEILALRWCDVDTRKSEIRIVRNLQMSSALGIIFNPPKTRAGNRKITVPDETIAAIQELRRRRKVEQIDGLIFTTAKGSLPYNPRNIEHTWQRIMKRTDVPYRNFHVLRHTHATDLLAAGVPIVEVARRLGHSRISHTLELYGHAIPSCDHEIAATIKRLYLVK